MNQPARVQAAAPHARPYRGGCQCGAVHYEVKLDLAHPGDPSRSVWQYFVAPSCFKLLIGDESLNGYQFFAESVHHFFCVRCGVRVFSHHMSNAAGDFYAVDVRNLHSRRAPNFGWQHVGSSAVARPD
ncbi:MAG: aldehyde-activating protein [Myxococcaceae bacterium]|nr:aldehyde-activating protein [Myxococcaceae bacterium]